MKVLMISTDRKIFEAGSAVRERLASYGQFFELHVVVFSVRGHVSKIRDSITPTVFVAATDSWAKIFIPFRAIIIGLRIIRRLQLLSPEKIVITAQDPFETGFAAFIISKFSRQPLHIQIHTDLYSPQFAQSILQKIRLGFARFVIKRAARIRVVSKRIADSLIENLALSPLRIDILPIFVDPKKFQALSTPEHVDLLRKNFKKCIVMISRLSVEKDISFALDIFSEVHKKHPDAGLIIVGSGPEKEKLSKKVERLSLATSVTFIPWTDDPSAYFKIADVFLLTSQFEGFGLTLLEAAYTGTPIVSSDVGIAEELSQSGVLQLCKTRDVSCFVKNISNILSLNHSRTQSKNINVSGLSESAPAFAQALTRSLEKTFT